MRHYCIWVCHLMKFINTKCPNTPIIQQSRPIKTYQKEFAANFILFHILPLMPLKTKTGINLCKKAPLCQKQFMRNSMIIK